MKQLTTQQIEAILDGRKTQFREVCKRQLLATRTIESKDSYCMSAFIEQESKHQIGDTLWKDTEYESVVIGVRVERFEDISDGDCEKEGVNHIGGGQIADTGDYFEAEYYLGELELTEDEMHYDNIFYEEPQDAVFELYEDIKPDSYVFVYEFERVKNG